MSRRALPIALALTLTLGAAEAKKRRPAPRPPAPPTVPAPAPPPVEPAPPVELKPEPPPAPTISPAPVETRPTPPGGIPPANPIQGGLAPPAPSPPAGEDLEALRGEYEAIRDELFRSRARLGMVGEAVFKTKLVVEVDYQAQRDWPLARLTVKLDDKQVYAEANPGTGKPLRAYDGFAAAGKHVISVSVESIPGEGRSGYGATGVFFVDVSDGRQTHVMVRADEVGDGPKPLAEKRRGRYDVRLRADVRIEELVKQ